MISPSGRIRFPETLSPSSKLNVCASCAEAVAEAATTPKASKANTENRKKRMVGLMGFDTYRGANIARRLGNQDVVRKRTESARAYPRDARAVNGVRTHRVL